MVAHAQTTRQYLLHKRGDAAPRLERAEGAANVTASGIYVGSRALFGKVVMRL
jgi:hypothetical protein